MIHLKSIYQNLPKFLVILSLTCVWSWQSIQSVASPQVESILAQAKTQKAPEPTADLSKIIEDWKNLATVLGIFVGGLWAYIKYFRGRTFKPRLELQVSGKLINEGKVNCILATMHIKNIGLSQVKLEKDYSRVEVSLYQPEFYDLVYKKTENVDKIRLPLWTEPTAKFHVFQAHWWIEPGEAITDHILVTLPHNNLVACKLDFCITSNKILLLRNAISWVATTIIEKNNIRRANHGYTRSTR